MLMVLEKLPKFALGVIALTLLFAGIAVTWHMLRFNNIFRLSSFENFDAIGVWLIIFMMVIAGIYFFDIAFKLMRRL